MAPRIRARGGPRPMGRARAQAPPKCASVNGPGRETPRSEHVSEKKYVYEDIWTFFDQFCPAVPKPIFSNLLFVDLVILVS